MVMWVTPIGGNQLRILLACPGTPVHRHSKALSTRQHPAQHPRVCSLATAVPSLLPLVEPRPTRSVMDSWVSMVSGSRAAAVALGGDALRGGLPPLSSPPSVPASGGTRMEAGGGGSDDMPARLGELKAAARVGMEGGQ